MHEIKAVILWAYELNEVGLVLEESKQLHAVGQVTHLPLGKYICIRGSKTKQR